jgi:hypothetical protein
MKQTEARDRFFRLDPSLSVFPLINESADYASEVRREILRGSYDCLAVSLPPSFEEPVIDGVMRLPEISAVVQRESGEQNSLNYVPIDPCQGMIMGIRIALQEYMPCKFVDMEADSYEVYEGTFPDPYALKTVPCEKFLAVLLPTIQRPLPGSRREARIYTMAHNLHMLAQQYKQVLFLCSVLDWPWVRDAYRTEQPLPEPERVAATPRLYDVSSKTLFFILGETPYTTYLYEKSRSDLNSDENLASDGIKELLIEARRRWEIKHELSFHHLNPQVLQLYLKYVRNLSLLERRLTPDLYTLAVAAKQIGGDSFAISLVETARDYPFHLKSDEGYSTVRFGLGQLEFFDGEVVPAKNRLAGEHKVWRSLPLKPEPEDRKIESFNAHVREQAKALIGEDLARSEKFTVSVKDGIDIRETLRHWYEGDVYVKEIPPSRGSVEVVLLIFERHASPGRFPWQQTWYAEHDEESTLCFYATDYLENMIGPGIGQSTYGGCFLLFPPRAIPNVWEDPRFAFTKTLEERLLAGALFHSAEPHVTLVSPGAPLLRWRQIARRFRKKIIHIPLNRFSLQTIQRLRRFHVLNGKQVRSYAAQFIREF